jgi:hypothetical protein
MNRGKRLNKEKNRTLVKRFSEVFVKGVRLRAHLQKTLPWFMGSFLPQNTIDAYHHTRGLILPSMKVKHQTHIDRAVKREGIAKAIRWIEK